jgi:hypothetical protein
MPPALCSMHRCYVNTLGHEGYHQHQNVVT